MSNHKKRHYSNPCLIFKLWYVKTLLTPGPSSVWQGRCFFLKEKWKKMSWKRNKRCFWKWRKKSNFIWNNSPYGPSSACRLPGPLCCWRPIFPRPGRPVSWNLATLHCRQDRIKCLVCSLTVCCPGQTDSGLSPSLGNTSGNNSESKI